MSALANALNPSQGFDNRRTSRGMDMDKLKEEGLPIASSITQADKQQHAGAVKRRQINRAKARPIRDDLTITKAGFTPDQGTEIFKDLGQTKMAAESQLQGALTGNALDLGQEAFKRGLDVAQNREVFDVYLPYMQNRQAIDDGLMNTMLDNQQRLQDAYADIQNQQMSNYYNMIGGMTGGMTGMMGGMMGGMGDMGGFGGMDPFGGGGFDPMGGYGNI